ncbi:MAG TPA: TonB-dependent receptor [Xanthomonadales bacterium]|nr:TonB-dependent receptor [Xanthomonadales bacterium]
MCTFINGQPVTSHLNFNKYLAACAFLSCWISPVAWTQEDSEIIELEEVVVTATRLPTDALRLPFAVARVGKEDIQVARQQLGLDEALSGVPGLFFQNRYNFAQDLRIAIRGFGARSNFGIRGIRIIADDISLTLPDGQASVDSIDLGSAESIEVIRGPFSAVYGAASGGVIVVRSEEGTPEPYLSGRLNMGSYDFIQGQLKTGGQFGNTSYMANLSSTELDGYRQQSKLETTLLNTRFRHQFDESTDLTVVFNAVDSPTAQDPGGLNAREVEEDRRQAAPRNVLFNAGESVEQQSLGAALTRLYGESELVLSGHYVNRDFDNRLPFDVNSNGQGGSVDLGRDFYGLSGRWTQHLAGGARIVFGGDYAAQRDHRKRFANNQGTLGDLTTDQDEDVTDYGVFAQAMWEPSEQLTVNIGGRYDQVDYEVTDRLGQGGSADTDFGEFSPMAGASWAFSDEVSFYGNVSRSFDPPATAELANPDGPTGFNQNLDSQTAVNYELGVKGSSDRLFYEVAVFFIDVDDAIVPFELEGSGQAFFENAGTASHDGVETILGFEFTDQLSASLSYTFSDFTFDEFLGLDGENYSGNRIPGIPEHLTQAEIRWSPVPEMNLTFDVLNASSFYANNANTVEDGDYTVANLRFDYRWQGSKIEATPFAGINNLFDEKYNGNVRLNAAFGRYFEPAPELNVYAGITIRWLP